MENGSASAGPGTELRIATIMTGGVSLAVWMGGVAAELHHLADADGPYAQRLVELGYDRVRVDVVTGTSAGGIDGALLAAALAWEVAPARFVDDLRSVWLDRGAFEALLRSPSEPDPASLLQGDAHLMTHLEEMLGGWFPSDAQRVALLDRRSNPIDPPIRLVITGTLLEPNVEVFVTARGPLREADHRGTFTFSGSDLLQEGAPSRLARAARSSASYPGAFEASLVRVGTDADDDLTDAANHTTSRFVIDGGLLVNRPVRLALDAIFGQRAVRPVHRALFYVVPRLRGEGGGEIDPTPKTDEPDEPTFAGVLTRAAGLPLSQTISDDLHALDEHNRRWRHQRANRLGWIASLLPNARDHLAEQLWSGFTDRRAEGSVIATLEGVARRNPRLELRTQWSAIIDGIEEGRRRADWHRDSFVATLPSEDDPRWRWGVSAVEYLFQVALDLVRISEPASGVGQDGTAEVVRELGELRADLHMVLDRVKAFQWLDRLYWETAFQHVGADGDDEVSWADWAADRYATWPAIAVPVDASTRRWIAAAVAGIRATAFGMGEAQGGDAAPPADDGAELQVPEVRIEQREAQLSLASAAETIVSVVRRWLVLVEGGRVSADGEPTSGDAFHAVLGDALGVAAADEQPGALLRALLAFWVIQVTTQHDRLEREQPIDLLPISSDGRVTIDPLHRASPDDKLTGIQLSHFGAFQKRSWRANDFMWGRLDAAERILDWLTEDGGGSAGSGHAPREEVKRRRQRIILEEELPHVADAIRASQAEGAAHGREAEAFLDAVAADGQGGDGEGADVGDLLGLCRVGQERLADELEANAFVRTATAAVAVGSSILAGARGGIPGLRRVAARARRWLILPVHRWVQLTRRRKRRGVFRGLGWRLASAIRRVARVLRR